MTWLVQIHKRKASVSAYNPILTIPLTDTAIKLKTAQSIMTKLQTVQKFQTARRAIIQSNWVPEIGRL